RIPANQEEVLETLSDIDNSPTYAEALRSSAQNTQFQISQSGASQIQEQENVDYLRERLTDEFSNYEKRIKSLEEDNKSYKNYLNILIIFIFILFFSFEIYIFYTHHLYDENYQLHKEHAEVKIRKQLWNSNVERIQKFVFNYLEDQKIL
ncbi:11755_t:CDS:2, partial [Racocetra persica]